MSITPVSPIEGFANYLAAVCITNGAEVPGEISYPVQLLKSLDDLDEEPDEDEDDADLEDEDDDDDEDEDEDDDLDDDEVDEDDDEEEDDDDEDEEEEDEDGGVKPLKVKSTARPSRVQ